MVDQHSRSMATWLGALARGGIVKMGPVATAGESIAAYVVGEEKVDALRAWFTQQSTDVVAREQRAAIEVCIWMAHADREVDPEERNMLREIVGASLLDDDTKDELVAATHDPPSIADLEKRLTHPVLRELMLALSWELASIDGRVARAEGDFYTGLARKLEVSKERAEEIRAAVGEKV